MPTLMRPVTGLPGIGPKLSERLGRLGIRTVQDLLFHFPLRYEDRTRVCPIASLRLGRAALVVGEVLLTQLRMGRRRSLVCALSDGTGRLHIRLFHFSAAQRAALQPGTRIRCFGEPRRGPSGMEMVHPEYRLVTAGEPIPVEATLTPVYPTTEGLLQPSLRRLTEAALRELERASPVELLPEGMLSEQGFPPLAEAIRTLHRPPPETSLTALEDGHHPARRRLAFEELLTHHLSLRALRERSRRLPAPPLSGRGELRRRLLEALPFELTGAQQRVVEEIRRDLGRPHPMHRLIQGDVGSGKTIVAALAALDVIEAGHQAAVMAPTEILAEQHRGSFSRWLAPLGIPVAWLSGRLNAGQRREVLQAVESGEARMVVGTHALFQKEVSFAKLGLAVIDEQHRFGVHQRLALREKGRAGLSQPHQLIMTATPIPRTLAMTAYADLDTSTIDELPPGRMPVETVAVPDTRREEVIARIEQACGAGRQAYWVCTLIEESQALEAEAAAETAERLAQALPGISIGMVHGRMRPSEKDAVMRRFQDGRLSLLVATTVIEVGVDVPRASLMIIENAERLGLAQLHQLRGRVGRGDTASSCVLLYKGPLSGTARARLAALRETNDGFAIAQRDLELRGPGEVLGTRQTGLPQLRVADLVRDRALLPRVQRAADLLLRAHPERVEALVQRWLGNAVHYADV